MKTYAELFLHLQSLPDPSILDWLSTGKWKGKDKQEALLRLFARLGLIPKINTDFNICIGNFNLNTLSRQHSFRDIFFTPNHKHVCLNDKGDSSDLSGIHKSNHQHLLLTTSKCLNRLSLRKLDIDSMLTYYQQYQDHFPILTLCIVVRDATQYHSMMQRTEKSSSELKKKILLHNPIVLDWNDLNDAYHQFRSIYGHVSFHDLIAVQKQPLVLRLHQKLCCLKTLRLKSLTNTILWGHIQRSGKSYMMGGAMMDDSKDKTECNYLVLTTAPNETILQYVRVFECSQLDGFNVVHLDGKSKKPVLKEKNIIICSKQFLQSKLDPTHSDETTRSISWLKKMTFDMRFVDESHNGGTTELAQKTLEYYGNGAFTIYITATYSKPTRDFRIPREHWVLWDLEDIHLCKHIQMEHNRKRLVEKHGDDMDRLLNEYSTDTIVADFSKYPDLDILTMSLHPDVLPEILDETMDNLYGWSPESCFLLKQGVDKTGKVFCETEFQNKEENLRLWRMIFGKYSRHGVPDKEYPDDLVFMRRIEKICKNPITSSRFVGDLDQNVIMAFLPSSNIDLVSRATKQLLEKENVVPDYDVLCINSKMTTDPKQSILDAKTRAKNRGKKGVLVLSGRQCSLGVTIEDCDIVLLFNNSNSYDMVFQMMFRCMTEGEGKKRGFVIDPNVHRVVETIMMEYGSIVKPNLHPREAVTYLMQEKLLSLNSDHWMQCFGHGSSQLTTLTESVYEIYSSRMSGALENLFKRMTLKQELFTKDDNEVMKTMFNNVNLTEEKTKKLLEEFSKLEEQEKLKKGIEKTLVLTEQQEQRDQDDETKRIDPIDILRPISIVISLLTIHHHDKSTLDEMFSLIDGNHKKKEILFNQVAVWWGKQMTIDKVDGIIRIFNKYLLQDTQTTLLIRQVKELFCKNIRNSRELSKIIDKYLIPQENEKKKNAEVSTPRPLRQDMLDAMPKEFWKEKRKVFEPCCGKGGFLMDIVDRFMTGLRDKIADEKLRYKEIVEECLFFSDINDMNIFICRLLLDPYNEYDLKFNEGDTLRLDVKEKWGLEGFDAVIGNPPYNSSGNTGTGNTIWQLFVLRALDKWLLRGEGRYLVFVHPSGWRKPNTDKGKFTGLYHRMVKENYMRRLSIHGVKDGMKTFRCGTRYDWYVMERVENGGGKTMIRDEKGKEVEETMSEGWEWFPNHSHGKVKRILAMEGEERCPIMYSRNAYGADKKEWMSKIKDEKHPYACVHSTPKSGVRYMYSSVKDRGMFGTPKIIFGESGIGHVVEDLGGNYGMTHGAMGIQVSDQHEMSELKKVLTSNEFHKIIDACMYSSFRIDWNIFKYFKRDFFEQI